MGVRKPDRHVETELIYLGMSTKQYRPWSPDQPYLLPPSPQDWLPQDHLAYFILDVISKLDLSSIECAIHAKDPRGERPYAPQLMVALLLYSYCTGAFSSRHIERNTTVDLGTRVISGDAHPDHSTIAGFRKTHLTALSGLFVQVVQLAAEVGLVKLGRVALDGSRFQANASKHKAMSYGHMKKKTERLDKEIAALLEQASRTDDEEDAVFGEDGYRDLPKELERRQARLNAIEQAMRKLEAQARQDRASKLDEQADGQEAKAADNSVSETERKKAATRAKKRRADAEKLRDSNDDQEPPTSRSSGDTKLPAAEPDDNDEQPLPKRQVRHTVDGEPHDRAQFNFTDPDSQLLEHKGGFLTGYNCQTVVTEDQLIVGKGVTNVAPDTHHLPALVDDVKTNCGDLPDKLLADTGYWAPENAEYCESNGVDAYIAVGRERKNVAGNKSGPDPPATPRDAMRSKMSTAEAREVYKARKWIVEPPFGQIKEAMGFRRFLLRGLENVRAEWAMVCTAHNLLKLWRYSPAMA